MAYEMHPDAQGSAPGPEAAAGAPVPELRGAPGAQVRERRFGETVLYTVTGAASEFRVAPRGEAAPFIEISFIEANEFAFKDNLRSVKQEVCGDAPASAGGDAERDATGWRTSSARVAIAPNGFDRHLRFDGEWRVTAARVPSDAVESLVPSLPRQIQLFERPSLLDEALRAFTVATAHSAKEQSAIEAYAFEQLAVEMVGASLLNRFGVARRDGNPRQVLFDQAMAIIAQQSHDPQLAPAIVAQEARTSLRQLQSLFADSGTSVAAEIRRQRARNARNLLSDSRFDVLTIDVVAERAGFGTTMSMRRALTDLYGAGPREIRTHRLREHNSH